MSTCQHVGLYLENLVFADIYRYEHLSFWCGELSPVVQVFLIYPV
jgi:hypothetical protein